MKNSRLLSLLIVVCLVANVSVQTTYMWQLEGRDTSCRNSVSIYYFEDGSTLALQDGETKSFLATRSNEVCRVMQRAEMGWNDFTQKPKKVIKVKLLKLNALKPERFYLLVGATYIYRLKNQGNDEQEQPQIPIVYTGQFPKDFVNEVSGWGSFPYEVLQKNLGKLLTLDIDFGKYCSLNCPHCFRKNNRVDLGTTKTMNYDDILDVIKQGKRLGLKSVKFLGAGEPFEHRRFLEFLRVLKSMEITPAIFTKGHVIGDDKLVKKWYSGYGINTGEELVAELKKVNASILLGFNSFNAKIQNKMVGGIDGYTQKRNCALELLVKAGFNQHNPTKLCLALNPITNDNYDEIFEMYKWARVRNLYPIVCPTMVSGRCGDEHSWQKITPSAEKLIALYAKIYKFNIAKGIQSAKQIKQEGISSYAGACPCHQIACGMYVTLTGTVLRCPGDDVTIFGNVWKQSLREIWENSENYNRAGTYNCGCPPKYGKSIPHNFYTDVMKQIV